jgi:putative aldouronate transport system permease protein
MAIFATPLEITAKYSISNLLSLFIGGLFFMPPIVAYIFLLFASELFKGNEYIFLALFGLLLLFILVCMLPIVRIIAFAFSSQSSVLAGQVLFWPVEPTASSLQFILKQNSFVHSFGFTALLTVVYVAVSMALTVLTAYPLSRKYFKGRSVFSFIIVFTMLFNGGLIPTYLVIKLLGIMDTFWVLILPCAISSFNVIILINHFRSVPESLEEAAKIDGASNFTILVRIMLPVSLPILATLTLFYAVGRWNGWFDALMYLNKREYYPLQLVLRDIILASSPEVKATLTTETSDISGPQVQSAAIILATLPIMVTYPFLQKYFIKGVMIGSIKS